MGNEITTVSLSDEIKRKAKKACEQIYGTSERKMSAYVEHLIINDCKERGIADDKTN